MRYNTTSMKKLMILVLSTLYLVLSFEPAKAQETTVCTQSYGGGVVCGVHTPVQTGIADNLPLIASGFLGAGGILAYFSNKRNKQI
jgi:hypothetical protein